MNYRCYQYYHNNLSVHKHYIMRRRIINYATLYYFCKSLKLTRKCRVRPLNANREFLEEGDGYDLIQKLREVNEVDSGAHFEYCRMTVEKFDELFERVKPLIEKKDTQLRKAIPALHRLYITLRFLTNGDSVSSIALSFRIEKSTTREIIREVCDAIWEVLQDELLTPTEENWKKIAKGFNHRWNFPNCIGAMDGRHIAIRCPPNTGSTFYNYKGFYSTILLALVDASYRFLMVDIGAPGRHGDSGVFTHSIIVRRFYANQMNVPLPAPINNDTILPFVVVGDAAFGLHKFLMTPYEGRKVKDDEEIFNYRLSRARRVVENAFGIMTERFKIYQRTIRSDPETVDSIIKATVVLHNYLMGTDRYCPQQFQDIIDQNGQVTNHNHDMVLEARRVFQSAGLTGGVANSRYGVSIRTKFKDYFNGDGFVPWQYNR